MVGVVSVANGAFVASNLDNQHDLLIPNRRKPEDGPSTSNYNGPPPILNCCVRGLLMKTDNLTSCAGMVSGEWIAALAGAFPLGSEEMGARVLEKHGLDNVSPEEWYPMAAFLDAMVEMAQEYSKMVGEENNYQGSAPGRGHLWHIGSQYLH